MKVDVWAQGYRTNGDSGSAHFWGSVEAEDLAGACKILASVDNQFKKNFEPERMTWWGCRLFDNETDARKTFG